MNSIAKAGIGVIGLGRIGKIHLKNLVENTNEVEVKAAISPSESSRQFALDMGVREVSSDPDTLFSNNQIDGVVICSPTSTHAQFIEQAVSAGMKVFCEKPIDLSFPRVQEVTKHIGSKGSNVMIGFNQRFDKDFATLKQLILDGRVGNLRTIKITSRDPSPPLISYIKTSGGLFHDMTIHDFDMARFLANSEVVELYATGGNLIDPEIGKAGDIDTAVVILQFENGCKAIIENSREASYGYDQRIEVFGSKGMIEAGNRNKNNLTIFDNSGSHSERLLDFFVDRYEDSYRIEINAFLQTIIAGSKAPVSIHDGLMASAIAEAANKSLKLNTPIKISDILHSFYPNP